VLGWEDSEGRPASAGGKRIRPSLCLAAAEAFGGRAEDALRGAVAIELVHNFSLVHDDIQDRDSERHGRPTLWVLLGEAQAINAGDYLYTLAIRTLVQGTGSAERRLAALQVLNTAIAAMIAGQWSDISFETHTDVTVEAYLAMVLGKTGALLGAPIEVGALLAGADGVTAALAGEWGRSVGLAFQAQDDYLGIWGDPAQTGKSTSSDMSRKKRTLPIILGLGHPVAGQFVRGAFGSEFLGASHARDVAEALRAAGADVACQDIARDQVAKANSLLAQLPISADARAELQQVAHFLVERSH
jgi:geranylgeranyl diphosphate synthase type I